MVVDGRQIDRPRNSLRVGVERARDVVSVEAEVEREVVPCACRNADVGKAVLHRDLGDDRLRAVTTGHPQDISAALDRIERELAEVETTVEKHRLDAAPA